MGEQEARQHFAQVVIRTNLTWRRAIARRVSLIAPNAEVALRVVSDGSCVNIEWRTRGNICSESVPINQVRGSKQDERRTGHYAGYCETEGPRSVQTRIAEKQVRDRDSYWWAGAFLPRIIR